MAMKSERQQNINAQQEKTIWLLSLYLQGWKKSEPLRSKLSEENRLRNNIMTKVKA